MADEAKSYKRRSDRDRSEPPQNVSGRSLPHSLEAEEYLISCCLLDGSDVISRCLEARIRPESFYDPKHGTIFEVLLNLYNTQKPIDVSVVAEELKTSRQLDTVGGYAFLAQVSSRIPTTAQAGYFIEKVREQSLLREIIRSATGAVEDCYGFSGGIDEFVDQVETKIFSVTQNRVSESAKQMREPTREAMNVITKMMMKKGELTGISSGFKDLDQMMWGFQKTEMIVLEPVLPWARLPSRSISPRPPRCRRRDRQPVS
jgi:replicative DNA helicase